MGDTMKKAHPAFWPILFLLIVAVFGCEAGDEGGDDNELENFFGPTAMAVTPDINDLRGVYLYVINSASDSLSVVDANFRTILYQHSFEDNRKDIIELGGAPHDVAITEDGNWLYVTDAVDGLVRRVGAQPPYNVTTTDVFSRVGRIVLPHGQPGPRAPYAYITSPDTMELVRMVVNPGADVEMPPRLELPGTPVAITSLFNGTILAITTEEADLIFVNTTSFEVLPERTIHLGGRPGNLQAEPGGDWLFVLNNYPSQVHIIDLNDYVETEEEVLFDVPLSNLGLDSSGEYLFFTSQIGSVYVFSTKYHRPCGASYEEVLFRDIYPQSDPELVDIEVFDCVTQNEYWYVEYDSDEDYWIVFGTASKTQTMRAYTDQYYISDESTIGFRIISGSRHPSDGDVFYFETKAGIKPIQVGLIPDSVISIPFWKEPEYDVVFISNTGGHNISILYTNDYISLGAIN